MDNFFTAVGDRLLTELPLAGLLGWVVAIVCFWRLISFQRQLLDVVKENTKAMASLKALLELTVRR